MGETTSWTDHVLAGASWRRFGFMLLCAPLLACVGFLIACIALFQFFSVLASGENNLQLRHLGRDLARLGVAIMDFLTYNTDRKPFPFGTRPSESHLAAGQTEASWESARSPRRATAGRRPRKTSSRKTTARRRSSVAARKPRSHPPAPETDKPPDETGGGEEGDRHE